MKTISVVVLFLMLPLFGYSQSSSQRGKDYNLDNNLAIQGYDPVAYFKQKKAVKGKKELAENYQGVIYYFSSSANKEAFTNNPTAYEPQYGGWCAFAMGDNNDKVSIDPETYKIIDGKLYLFYNAFFNNTLKSWNKNEAKLKSQADKNWNQRLNQ